jgi:hypothetical protein
MEFGIFHEFNRLQDWTEAEAFARSFEQVDACEQGGVDVLWLAELHFTTEYSVLSAPIAGRECDRGSDAAHKDRHGRARAALVPAAAHCRGGGHP